MRQKVRRLGARLTKLSLPVTYAYEDDEQDGDGAQNRHREPTVLLSPCGQQHSGKRQEQPKSDDRYADADDESGKPRDKGPCDEVGVLGSQSVAHTAMMRWYPRERYQLRREELGEESDIAPGAE
jgi:hypothetical protein